MKKLMFFLAELYQLSTFTSKDSPKKFIDSTYTNPQSGVRPFVLDLQISVDSLSLKGSPSYTLEKIDGSLWGMPKRPGPRTA